MKAGTFNKCSICGERHDWQDFRCLECHGPLKEGIPGTYRWICEKCGLIHSRGFGHFARSRYAKGNEGAISDLFTIHADELD